MFVFRTGPHFLFFRTSDPHLLREYLLSLPDSEQLPLHECLDRSGEDSVVCFVREDRADAILVQREIGTCLAELLNHEDLRHLPFQVTPGPASIIMRSAGNPDALRTRLSREFRASAESWENALQVATRDDTILALTPLPVNAPLRESDLTGPCLLIPLPGHRVQQRLRSEAILYITENLEDHSWSELRITIFDTHDQQLLHYERLLCVVRELETGMILAERWTRDTAFTLMTVPAFEIRLCTFEPVADVKRLLVGLEYDDEGRRLVDFDLFTGNRKISWAQAVPQQTPSTRATSKNRLMQRFLPPPRPQIGKETFGRQCRAALCTRLGPRSSEELRALEARLADRSSPT